MFICQLLWILHILHIHYMHYRYYIHSFITKWGYVLLKNLSDTSNWFEEQLTWRLLSDKVIKANLKLNLSIELLYIVKKEKNKFFLII